jgi:hypothetical protein
MGMPAEWTVMDDEHTNDPSIWSWGDWCITKEVDGYHLLVSSGVGYGPFSTFDATTRHAEDVRGD